MHPHDPQRALSGPKGDLRLYVWLDEIEELLEALIAAYNATPPRRPERAHDGGRLHIVAPAEPAAVTVWIENWQRILSVVKTTRSFMTAALKRAVLAFVDQPTPLSGST